MKLYIDFSTLDEYRLCPQKFIYKSILNLSSGSTEALDFGTLVHFGTELLGMASLSSLPSLETIDQEIAFLMENPPQANECKDNLIRILHYTAEEASKYPNIFNLPPVFRRSVKHLLTLISRYAINYFPEPLKLNTFESQLEAYLGTTSSGVDIFYRGTRDGLGDDFILERKSTSFLGSKFEQMVNPNNQASGYIWLEQTLGNDLDRIIFDGISTTGYGMNPKYKTSDESKWDIYRNPQKLFQRLETTRDKLQIQEWKQDVLYTCERLVNDILNALKSDYMAPKNAPKACDTYNTLCAYKQLCSLNVDYRNQLINAFERNEKPWKGFALEDNSGKVLFGSRVDDEDEGGIQI